MFASAHVEIVGYHPRYHPEKAQTLKIFHFIRCYLSEANLGRESGEMHERVGTVLVVYCLISPLIFPLVTTLLKIDEVQSAFQALGDLDARRSYSWLALSFLVFSPFAYALLFSSRARRAQVEYENGHRAVIRQRLSANVFTKWTVYFVLLACILTGLVTASADPVAGAAICILQIALLSYIVERVFPASIARS